MIARWRATAGTVARAALLASLASLGAPFACARETPSSTPRQRTVQSMSAHITRDLTPRTMARRFGAPDDTTGSGLLIYGYRLADARTLWLAFPGHAPITYAQVESPDGTRQWLRLRQASR